MKRSFKFLSVLLVLLFVCTLVGCGKSKEQIVGEAAAKYIAEHSEYAGATVIGNLMSDDENVIVLDMQLPSGEYFNLAIVIKGFTYNFAGYAFAYFTGETHSSTESKFDELREYLFDNARKKLKLDIPTINSYLQ